MTEAEEVALLKARMRDLIKLMEADAANGHIWLGPTRTAILKKCRELVGGIPPPKSLDQLLSEP